MSLVIFWLRGKQFLLLTDIFSWYFSLYVLFHLAQNILDIFYSKSFLDQGKVGTCSMALLHWMCLFLYIYMSVPHSFFDSRRIHHHHHSLQKHYYYLNFGILYFIITIHILSLKILFQIEKKNLISQKFATDIFLEVAILFL